MHSQMIIVCNGKLHLRLLFRTSTWSGSLSGSSPITEGFLPAGAAYTATAAMHSARIVLEMAMFS